MLAWKKRLRARWVELELGSPAQLRRLLKNPDIKMIKIVNFANVDDTLIIRTKNIWLTRLNARRGCIGNWEIAINLQSQYITQFEHGWLTPQIHFREEVKQGSHPRHFGAAIPYSKSGNAPCWGNLLPSIRGLYKARQFAPLALLSLEFLKSMASQFYGMGYDAARSVAVIVRPPRDGE